MASQDKYAKALANGKIDPDLVPIATRSEQGWGLAGADEMPRPGTTVDTLQTLRTPFRPHGRVTAGNASGLTDGATGCLLVAADVAEELGLPVRMRMVAYAFAGVDPETMGTGPIPATEKALAKAGLTIDDIGLIEINEAFAVQVLAFTDYFGLADDDERINQYGGAIAMGHPLASSGVRLMTQLARQFAERPGRPVRPHHHVRRARHGRHGDLGEPDTSTRPHPPAPTHRTADRRPPAGSAL